MLPIELEAFFALLEEEPYKVIQEDELFIDLKKYISDNSISQTEFVASELKAFGFREDWKHEESINEKYYSPRHQMGGGNEILRYPDIKNISVNDIQYFESRANCSKNPWLKSRYSGIIHDYSFEITGKKSSYNNAIIHIDSLFDSVVQNLHKSNSKNKSKLSRALKIALSFNQIQKVDKIKNYLILKDEQIEMTECKNIFMSSFDLLVDKKILKPCEENKIIDLLEKRLDTLIKIDLYACVAISDRLTDYYNRKNLKDKVREVLDKLRKSYEVYIEDKLPIIAVGLLEELLKRYDNFQLKSESDELLIQIRELGKNTDAYLKKISSSFEVDKNKLLEYAKRILKYDDLDVMFARIIKSQIAPIENLDKEVENLYKNGSLTLHLNQSVVDGNGRKIAHIGPYLNDKEGHRVFYYYKMLIINGFLLDYIFIEGLNKSQLTADIIVKFLKKSCIIKTERIPIIDTAIECYFRGEYAACIHLLIPQFEEAIRNLIEINGGNVLVMKDDIFKLKTLDHILKDDILKNAFGEDLVFYFRVLLTDNRGWNLRNQIAHGLINPALLDKNAAQRILHSFFCLGMIRWKTLENDGTTL